MRKRMGFLILCVLWFTVQACSPHFLIEGKKKITWSRPPKPAKEEKKEPADKVKKSNHKKALANLRAKHQKDIEELQLKIEKLQTENMLLADSIEVQQQDILKKNQTIALQQKVIQLLDDPQKTIEKGLQKQIESLNLSDSADVSNVKDVKFVFWDQLLFEPGQAHITAEGKALLQKLSEDLLNRYKDCLIIVEGHTDDRPVGKKSPFESNWELSTARATAVVRFLEDKAGIDPTRLSATGYGQYRPAAGNDTVEGRRQNRRIEIILSRKK